MNTLQYLDAVKAHLHLPSDYALAKSLGIKQQAVSNYRSGRSRMDDDVALKVAHCLNVNPLQVIAAANIERAKSDEIRAMWEGLMEKISTGFNALVSPRNPRRVRI